MICLSYTLLSMCLYFKMFEKRTPIHLDKCIIFKMNTYTLYGYGVT